MDYRDYQHLTFERRERGVVLVTINRPEVLNATNDRLHWELTQVWLTLDADETARVAVVTGAGRAFSAGGDLDRAGVGGGRSAADQVLPRPLEVGGRLARGAQQAIRWTKRSLNSWLRQAGPIFDQSIALEMLTFMDEGVREGLGAIREKRPPAFPSGR